MKKKKIALIIAGLITIGVISSFFFQHKKSGQQQKTTEDVESIENSTVSLTKPENHVSSPDIENPEDLDTITGADGLKHYKNISEQFCFSIPDGYTLKKSGSIYYLRNADNSIQLALAVSGNSFNSVSDVFVARKDYINRMTGIFDGKEHILFNYGTGERPEKKVGDYVVQNETAEAWFHNDDDTDIYKSQAYTYYTTMQQKGVILMGISDGNRESVYDAMDTVLKSLKTYNPTAEELHPSIEFTSYKSEGKDAVEIAYPKGWDISNNSDGMVIIKSTEDDSSPYTGMIIEYLADPEKKIVDDYAEFAGSYEYQLLLPYFVQPVGDNAFNYKNAVTNTNLHAKIGQKECILFDVSDEIIPVATSIRNSMMSDNYMVKSKRYTFQTNGVDCMLNFILPSDTGVELMNQILARTTIN